MFIASCGKQELRDQKKELNRMEGTWNVDERTYETFDASGNSLSFQTFSNLGEIKFQLSQDYSKNSSLAFNTVSFVPSAFYTTYDYLNSFGAGDLIDGVYYCHWEVDPDQKRILFWGIAPNSSYHLTYDMELVDKGKKKRILKFITPTSVEKYYISKK